MLDLSLFRKPTFAGASIVAFALSASMFAMFLYITLYMQNILGYSPLEAGLRFLPITARLVLRRADRRAALRALPMRLLLGGGLLLVGVGLLLMRGVSTRLELDRAAAGLPARRRRHRPGEPAARLDRGRRGAAAAQRHGLGHQHTFRQVGIATGIAGLGAIFQSRVQDKAASLLAGTPGISPTGIGHQVATGATETAVKSAPAGVQAQVAAAANDAFCSGFNEIVLIAAAIAFVGAMLALALTRQRDLITHGSHAAETPAAA